MALEGTRYDQIGSRLTEVHDGQTDTYTYLANSMAGNPPILDEVQQLGGTRAFTFGAAGHQEAVNNAGNLIDFDSDAEGRLTQLSRSGNVATFLYDGRSFLARAEETGTGSTTEPTYASEGLLYSMSHSQNGVPPITLEHVLYFAGRPVAIVTGPPTGLVTQSFLSTDHLGTPFVATDDGADEVWAGGFEPFGKDWQAGLPGGAQENGMFLRFPGQWFDEVWEAASLGVEGYYNLHRWYQAETGRYLRPDPLSLPRTTRAYGYADQRPLVLLDKHGLQAALMRGRRRDAMAFDRGCCPPDAGCCAAALGQGLFDLKENRGGIVICCNGRKVPCSLKISGGLSASGDLAISLLAKCILRHEQEHVEDLIVQPCPEFCTPRVFLIEFPSPTARYQSECRGFGTELRCLESSMQACGGQPVCLNVLQVRKDELVTAMQNFPVKCGNSP